MPISHLTFDYEFVESMTDKFSKCHDSELMAHKFVSVLNKILLFHGGPILTFFLVFPDRFFGSQVIHESNINQLIPFFRESRNLT